MAMAFLVMYRRLAGVSKTEWSWSTLASDFDNDGNRDIFVANGYAEIYLMAILTKARQHMTAIWISINLRRIFFKRI